MALAEYNLYMTSYLLAALGNNVEFIGTCLNSTSLAIDKILSGSVPWCATTTLCEVGSVAMKTGGAKVSFTRAVNISVRVRRTARDSTVIPACLEDLDVVDHIALRATVQGCDGSGGAICESGKLCWAKQICVDVTLRDWRRCPVGLLTRTKIETKERQRGGP